MSTISIRTASAVSASDWKPDVDYSPPNRVKYKDIIYECQQAHRSQVGWEPPNVPALWRIPTPTGTTRWQAQTQYRVGSMVTFQGGNYKCIQEHMSLADWTPPAVPALWTKVNMIRGVLCPSEVVLGESFTVSVTLTDPNPNVIIAINGNPGASQTFQFCDFVGTHIINITVSSKDSFSEARRIELNVKAADDAHHKFPFISITGKQSTSAAFMIGNLRDHLPGTTYTWDFGPAGQASSDGTCSTIRSFEQFLDPDKPFTTFNVQLTANFPDKTSLRASKSLIVYNQYFIDKKSGVIKPNLTYDYNAYRDGDKYVGRAKIKNVEKEDFIFTKRLVQYVPRDGEKQPVADPVEAIAVKIPAGTTLDIDFVCGTPVPGHPFPIPHNELLGYVVHLKGESSMSKTPVMASFHFEVKESKNVQLVKDRSVVAALHQMRNQPINQGKTIFTRQELEAHLATLESRGATGDAIAVRKGVDQGPAGLLSHILKVQRQVGTGTYEGQPCLPDETPPEDDLACQLTNEWQWVITPARIANAYKGDTILSPGESGAIARLLHRLDPAQLYSHCGIMTQNHYQIRHCTANEDRYQDYKVGKFLSWEGTDGIDPDVLKYGWPGTVTQSVQGAYNGEPMVDPQNGKTYSVSSFHYDSPLFGSNTLPVDPLVVMPDPFIEATIPSVRQTLHKVADIAKTLNGHYRFYAYTDSTISMGDQPQYIAPDRANWWASKTLPLVCSSFIWSAMKRCEDPRIQLEGVDDFTKWEDLEPQDTAPEVGAEVDANTRDGLYFYEEQERRNAAHELYSFGHDLAEAIIPAGVPDWAAGDAPDDVGNELVNVFAFDWAGENANGDNAKDSGDWQDDCGVGHAVSPDNILNWDAPTEIKDGVQHGVYGYSIKAEYRPESYEYRRISRWVRVKKMGTLTGSVSYDHQPVGGANVEIAGQTAVTKEDGTFTLGDIPVGSYDCKAGKVMNGEYMSVTVSVTIKFDETTSIVLVLLEPDDWYREAIFDGVLQIHEEEWGNDGWYNRDRAPNQHQDALYVGPFATHAEYPFDQWCDDLHITGRVSFDWLFGGRIRATAEATIRQSGHRDASNAVSVEVEKDATTGFTLNVDDGDDNWMYVYGTVTNKRHGR